MNYEKVFKIWIRIVGCFIFSFVAISVVVDPINAIGFPIVKGLNNNKCSQDQYMDVFKPYELARKKPDIVFIGTSRVYRGIKPSIIGIDDNKVYNLGLSSLSLDHMQSYLNFAYKIHQPKKVFIGVDVFNFSKNNYKNRHIGFSQQRLDSISNTSSIFYAIRDTLQLGWKPIKNTLMESHKNKNADLLFKSGWYVRDDEAPEIVLEGYYFNLNSYIDTYRKFEYTDDAIVCLENIVNEAKNRGIEVYVFFNPIGADIRNIIYLCGHGEEMKRIKQEVTNRIGKVYDFNFNNIYTENRRYYYDASHFSPKIGEFVKLDILSNKNSERMHILTPGNVNMYIDEDMRRYKSWAYKNMDYVNDMKEKIKNREKIKDGEFSVYFGF